jgi:hypothetical protein
MRNRETVKGRSLLAQEAEAGWSGEGRWPRIYARVRADEAPVVRCAHVF